MKSVKHARKEVSITHAQSKCGAQHAKKQQHKKSANNLLTMTFKHWPKAHCTEHFRVLLNKVKEIFTGFLSFQTIFLLYRMKGEEKEQGWRPSMHQQKRKAHPFLPLYFMKSKHNGIHGHQTLYSSQQGRGCLPGKLILYQLYDSRCKWFT